MNFSDLLLKEIAKKKTAPTAGGSKYLDRKAIEKERQEKYWRDQEESEKKKRENAKRRREEDQLELQETAKKREKLALKRAGKLPAALGTESTDLPPSVAETVEELRRAGEPVTIFGESDTDRYNRLLKVQAKEQARLNRIEAEKLEASADFAIEAQEISTDHDKVNLQIRAYLHYLLQQWQSQENSDSIAKETRASLEPLFQELRDKTLNPKMFPTLATILFYLQQKDYRKANDAYIELSIGKALWPIGILASGIHDRSHPEDADVNQASSIVRDEAARNWLTAIKRLVTFAEKSDKSSKTASS